MLHGTVEVLEVVEPVGVTGAITPGTTLACALPMRTGGVPDTR